MTIENRKTIKNSDKSLPLLLRNLKKVFKDKMTGPIKKDKYNYQLAIGPTILKDVIDFLQKRRINHLTGIIAWKSKNEIKLSYQLAGIIGNKFKESEIAIICRLKNNRQKIATITDLFPIATIFEGEITEKYQIIFSRKER
jgi:Ni,Fe-hydrogenase III component G